MKAVEVVAQWGGHMWSWNSGWAWLWMVVFWALVVAVIVFAVRRGGDGAGTRSAADVLAERYARGEINTDEYRDRLRVLDETRGDRTGR